MITTLNQFPYSDPKTRALAELLLKSGDSPLNDILVVGCGNGIEAAVLSDSLKARVIGIDIETDFDQIASNFADLRYGDATQIAFSDCQFDAVYSFHALEHIPDYRGALREIRRVLRVGGVWLIGTPNRNRIVGYVGSTDATLLEKVKWNIADWKARLNGEFRNECGAHAGFSAEELHNELGAMFSESRNITLPYYLNVYSRMNLLIKSLNFFRLTRWTFPAIYFLGRK